MLSWQDQTGQARQGKAGKTWGNVKPGRQDQAKLVRPRGRAKRVVAGNATAITKDQNAKIQMFRFCLPSFWGQKLPSLSDDISASGGPF